MFRTILSAAFMTAGLSTGAASAQQMSYAATDSLLQKTCFSAAADHFGTASVAISESMSIPGGVAYEFTTATSDETYTCHAIRGSYYVANAQ